MPTKEDLVKLRYVPPAQGEAVFMPFFDSFLLLEGMPVGSISFFADRKLDPSRQSSSLPIAPHNFGLVTGLQFQYFPGDNQENYFHAWNRLRCRGNVQFMIGAKVYFECAPIGAKVMRKITPCFLKPGEPFCVSVYFPDPFVARHNGLLFCYLLNTKYRPVQ